MAVAYPNLSAEMKRMGITQGDLADAIGVTQVTVSRWFNGHRRPSVETCFKVKERLFPNLTVDYLFSSEPDWLTK
jgi:transcriptional regulator with XRE-family HTH domain